MAKQAVVPPELNIPPSDHTVEVSVIDSARISHLPSKFFMSPSIPGYDVIDAPCHSFLIKRKNAAKPGKYDQMVFRLGHSERLEEWPTIGSRQGDPRRLQDRSGQRRGGDFEGGVARILGRSAPSSGVMATLSVPSSLLT